MSLEEDWNVSIDGYNLLKHLGGGSYGTVFLTKYYPDDSLRVVKVLHQLGYDPEKRFEREIRILQDRLSPNTVQVLDFGSTYANHKYYAMEYCPLGDIRKFVGLVNINFALQVLNGVCLALAPFHERDGFHRDIKPDNILMVQDNGVLKFKLSDFGLAQDNNTSSIFTNNPAGTIGYLAPEIIAGRPFTPASDIYSLGVTIRELINGNLQDVNLPLEKFGKLKPVLRDMLIRDPVRRVSLERLRKYVNYHLRTEPEHTNTLALPRLAPQN